MVVRYGHRSEHCTDSMAVAVSLLYPPPGQSQFGEPLGFFFSVVYASPQSHLREALWEELTLFHDQNPFPWCVA